MKRLSILLLVLLLGGGAVAGYFYTQGQAKAVRFRTARVERGPLVAVVSATGTLNAVITVQVGSQVSGQIKALYADFNSQVKKGQLVALIDPDIFDAAVKQAQGDADAAKANVLNQEAVVAKTRADLQNARAALVQGKANVAKAEVSIVDTKRNLARMQELRRGDLIAQADEDTAQVNYDSAVAQRDAMAAQEQALAAAVQSAEAQLKVVEAQLTAARAQVAQKTAALRQAQLNLDHTRIQAPVDGVVVARNVDVGQTVAASLQAPTLFLIAQDLTRMQVDTNVDEADVGRVRVGQPAPFTVDAFPGQVFQGRVTEIRKAPQVVQNVVTYDVVVSAPNPDQHLLPGMTANVRITVEQKDSVLKVANAALRYRPAGAEMPAPTAPERGASGGGRQSVDTMLQRLTGSLGLSAEQQGKLRPILEDAHQQMTALAKLNEQERQTRATRIRETTRQRIRAILTPEQQARYDQSAGAEVRTPGRVWIVGRDGKPTAVAVTLGMSDGTSTEVLGGDLQEGQELIIGTAAGAAGRTSTGGGPRLRL